MPTASCAVWRRCDGVWSSWTRSPRPVTIRQARSDAEKLGSARPDPCVPVAIAPAIACGNAFILKPSERDPGVPMKLAELMIEAGLPPGILNVVNGDKEAVDAILDDPDIRAVGFVGSSPIAPYLYERAAASGQRCQCFRGTHNPAIIMP